MGISASDVVPFTQARANLSELADAVKAGAEKVITKNGESYVALIDADRLDYYHRLERERIHLLLLDDARRGLEDIAAGRTEDAASAIARLQKQRAAKTTPARLKLGKGETIFLTETPDGYTLTPYDPALEEEIVVGRKFMREFRDTFHQLAK